MHEENNNKRKLFIDSTGSEKRNYTGDEDSERDFRPVRQSHEYRSGCLGGLMYFVFIVCVSVILACVSWMAASDMLALNKEKFSAVVSLPMDIFTSETVDKYDEDGNKTGTRRVTHADIDYVAQELKESGLIEYKWLFLFYCNLSNAANKVDPGEYELQSSFDYRALIKNMQAGSGATKTIKVTIPEGFSMHQIFTRLEENNVCSYDELIDAAANYNYNYSFLDGIPMGDASRLEGFLFPDTYEFYVGMQASSAINKFLENFHYKLTADMIKAMNNMGLDIRSVVNIASLIEKEAANDDERRTIASVIYNRLGSYAPLGIDASILYLHPDHEGAPTGTMLEEDSPYNTRIYQGLPPTPIANPGLPSIYAVLNPEKTNYYYYALDEEAGAHRFFAHSAEFNEFVATQSYGQN
ncbi:MAG: endolytic transglycosylase MltG [Eubacteriales bacterium]|nr:endolytic transglycosylase MltG [Eubacteriales bacterium]